MYSSSTIELSRNALKKNIKFIKSEIGDGVMISSVIKGNAYGHGIESFAPMAESCGLNHFSVFDAGEAYRARSCLSAESRITVMGDIEEEAIPWAIENGVSFYVYELSRLRAALEAAGKVGMPARIHLEIETGLNRTGLEGGWIPAAIEIIRKHPDLIRVEGMCTHYAGAESSANYKRIQDQMVAFDDHCRAIRQQGISPGRRHSAASAAALAYPETRMDMVRIGIAQYGLWPSKETAMRFILRAEGEGKRRFVDPLKRVLKWKSHVMSVKNVKRGEFVGYGNAYLTSRPQKIAAVPIGYYHGFRRSLSNLGRVLIHGKRAGIVGTVNMNMVLVNVSELDNVEIGDEVVIIGKQKNLQITVSSFSDMSNLLNYEALVRLPSGIPRVVVP